MDDPIEQVNNRVDDLRSDLIDLNGHLTDTNGRITNILHDLLDRIATTNHNVDVLSQRLGGLIHTLDRYFHDILILFIENKNEHQVLIQRIQDLEGGHDGMDVIGEADV
jgi:hypothetical protein